MNTRVIRYEDLKRVSRTQGSPRCYWNSPNGRRSAREQAEEEANPVRGVITQLRFPPGIELANVPNAADKVHRNETCGEAFDKFPATVELLQKVSTARFGTPIPRDVLVCTPTLSKGDAKEGQ